MIIATKTGDNGYTTLKCGRVHKSDARIEAIGCLDELNAFIGMTKVKDPYEFQFLQQIQRDIMTIMSIIGGYDAKIEENSLKTIDKRVEILQSNSALEQKDWVYYGTNEVSVWFDICSKQCRRVERVMVAIPKIPHIVMQYINRLSDLFYLLARYRALI